MMEGWRVLAAHREHGGGLMPVTPDWEALRRAGRPVTLVVRLDGPRGLSDSDRLREDLLALYQTWQSELPALAGVEIDHDSATVRLADYAAFLASMKRVLPPRARLSATVLPTWLDAPALADLRRNTDETVLQLHAILAPQLGIFDRTEALSWIGRYGKQGRQPFRIALPTYGIRLDRAEDGTVLAVESEAPLMAGGVGGSELRVKPEEIGALLKELGADRPEGLTGVNWFRLPVVGDRRAWSLATLRAVMNGTLLAAPARIVAEPGSSPGLFLLHAANDGATDAALPARIGLSEACQEADGGKDYHLETSAGRLWLVRNQDFPLHEGQRMAIGWARCATLPENFHVEP